MLDIFWVLGVYCVEPVTKGLAKRVENRIKSKASAQFPSGAFSSFSRAARLHLTSALISKLIITLKHRINYLNFLRYWAFDQ